MLQGSAYAYVSHLDRMRNGRVAIQAVHAHYEGELTISQTKAQVYGVIKNAACNSGSNGTGHSICTLHFIRSLIKF